ncbi:MAG TPA: metal ABC transporter substrate-binding protein [Acidimicrobiales bacterium]|nr:metal ABC transporter substrate-binding protein [Acidimicrobiales bacterium]
MSVTRRLRSATVALAAVVALATAACATGSSAKEPGAGSSGRLRVVTTVAPITSIAAEVIGDRATIDGVVPEGTNSHTFEPAPSVAKVLSQADVIFVNGLKLEDPTVELARKNMKKSARIVEIGTTVLPESDYIYDFSFPKSEGKPNPHLWTDPLYARKYAKVIADTMAAADAKNATAYTASYDAFSKQIDELDAAMRTSFATIAPERRKLLTYHDAYAYFAKDYGWQVVGAIQVDSFKDPSPKAVAALIQQVKQENVPAIFGSEVFPSPVLAQIGRETGVKYVDTLRDDDLPGKPGDRDHSWLGLMRADYVTMTTAMGGDAGALEKVVVADVVPDRARYPQ